MYDEDGGGGGEEGCEIFHNRFQISCFFMSSPKQKNKNSCYSYEN